MNNKKTNYPIKRIPDQAHYKTRSLNGQQAHEKVVIVIKEIQTESTAPHGNIHTPKWLKSKQLTVSSVDEDEELVGV